MGWTLWTIVGVLMIPVVVGGVLVAWRDRRRRRNTGARYEHEAGSGAGYASAGFAATHRQMGGGGGS